MWEQDLVIWLHLLPGKFQASTSIFKGHSLGLFHFTFLSSICLLSSKSFLLLFSAFWGDRGHYFSRTQEKNTLHDQCHIASQNHWRYSPASACAVGDLDKTKCSWRPPTFFTACIMQSEITLVTQTQVETWQSRRWGPNNYLAPAERLHWELIWLHTLKQNYFLKAGLHTVFSLQ